MTSFKHLLTACILGLLTLPLMAQTTVEQWGLFELKLPVSKENGNPFDKKLTATFSCPDTTITVTGFYDGNLNYCVRFMPTHQGTWKYATRSSVGAISGKRGSFECVAPSSDNHGMVRVAPDGMNFAYADGTRFYPVGTTAYGWSQGNESLKATTLKTFERTGFNKVRMCIFPAVSHFPKEDPVELPFACNRTVGEDGKYVYDWDFSRPNPLYFQNIERCIVELQKRGIEADLILFHPYDKGRWGLDNMPMADNLRYLGYIAARMSAYRNVWWSMANEFDLIKYRQWEDWDVMSRHITEQDPFDHLCSIHGATATYYDYWRPQFTHTSIQDEAPVLHPGRANLIRNIYKKPIIFDEVCYEGDVVNRWGRLSGQELLYRMLNGLMSGCYVSHGECLEGGAEVDNRRFISMGGLMVGGCQERIKFLRSVLEATPGYLEPADESRDEQTATAGDGYYLVYLGREMADKWVFSLPTKNAGYSKLTAGRKFRVEIINMWDMTISSVPQVFETAKMGNDRYRLYDKELRHVLIPYAPFIILRVVEVKE